MRRLTSKLGAVALLLAGVASFASAEGLTADRLGVLYNLDDAAGHDLAAYYAGRRSVPPANVIGVRLGSANAISPDAFTPLRRRILEQLPAAVESLVLVWSRPFAVGCMSITSAFAAGYQAAFCPVECAQTPRSPLFDSDGWLPADTVGWWPAMLMPTDDPNLTRELIGRGIAAEGSAPTGTVYLVRTGDPHRNVRAEGYAEVTAMLGDKVRYAELSTPIASDVPGALAYFTGTAHVEELPRIHFVPGGVADHLTSTGGVLFGGSQTSILAWIKQGATGSYGSVSEPCAYLTKFPDASVFLRRYLGGETLLESYWKSVAMPGQGLFIGEPLARPYAARHR